MLTPQDIQPTKKSQKNFLPPSEPIAVAFLQYFHHPWDFIITDAKEKAWKTVKKHYLEPRTLWERYKDPSQIIGLRFGKTTNYCLIDIDRESIIHPYQNEQAFNNLLAALEDIGLCNPVIIRSSDSEGIHIYYFFPQALNTFDVACTLTQALTQAGLTIQQGTLETFPNTKAYGSQYNGHRLPLQTDSYLLDNDYQPYSNNLEHFLRLAQESAQNQDIETFLPIFSNARDWYIYQKKIRYHQSSVNQWKKDTEALIKQGWTGRGQTNNLLKEIGKYCRVFLRLSGKALYETMCQIATQCPGYAQYCGHTKEILQRCKHWAKIIEPFWTPLCSTPYRLQTHVEMMERGINSLSHPNNEEKQEEARNRIQTAYNHLKEQNIIPKTIKSLIKAIIKTAKDLLGCGISEQTLRKSQNLSLWHPDHQDPPLQYQSEHQPPSSNLSQQEGSNISVSSSQYPPQINTNALPPESPPNVLRKKKIRQSDPLPDKNPENGSRHQNVTQKTVENPKNQKQPETSPCKDSDNRIYTPPIMKGLLRQLKEAPQIIFKFPKLITGLIQTEGANRPIAKSLEPNTLVQLCEAQHSQHPKIVYVKPVEGAEDWLEGQGIAVSIHHLEPL